MKATTIIDFSLADSVITPPVLVRHLRMLQGKQRDLLGVSARWIFEPEATLTFRVADVPAVINPECPIFPKWTPTRSDVNPFWYTNRVYNIRIGYEDFSKVMLGGPIIDPEKPIKQNSIYGWLYFGEVLKNPY